MTWKLFACEIPPELEVWSSELKKRSERPIADLLFGHQSVRGLLQEWQNCSRRHYMAVAGVGWKRGTATIE